MIIREAKYKDYPKIKILAQKYNLSIYEKKEWEEIWINNPYIKDINTSWPIGWVIEDKDKIVGHLSNIPTEYYFNNKNYIGSIISCWVVEPEYRVHSIKLIKKYHDQEKRDFFIATTSNIKTAKTLKAFGWQEMPNLNFNSKLNIILNFKRIFKAYMKKKFNISSIFILPFFYLLNIFMFYKINKWRNINQDDNLKYFDKFNSNFDELWKNLKIKNKNLFQFNRSSTWLNWHLNNVAKYKNLSIIVKKEENKIIGYAITIYKHDKNLNIKKAVLIDINVLNEDEKTYKNMITASIKKSQNDKCDLFQISGFNHLKRKIMLQLNPFKTKNKFSPFYFFTKDDHLKKNLEKKESWEPSEIDGDSIF